MADAEHYVIWGSQTTDGPAWCTLADMYRVWPAAEEIFATEDELSSLRIFMDAAQVSCEAYAPTLPAPDEDGDLDIPVNYTVAVAMQTRNLWNASRIDPAATQVGDGEFAVTVFPLDNQIKALLRPKSGRPRVG